MFTKILIKESDVAFTFIRSPGPGGQNVNKVASGAVLRFNVHQSVLLPEAIRARLILLAHNKITQEGELIIKACRYRTQERNKQDALERLQELIYKATLVPKKREKTKPTRASKERHLATKKLHSKTKSLRTYKIDD